MFDMGGDVCLRAMGVMDEKSHVSRYVFEAYHLLCSQIDGLSWVQTALHTAATAPSEARMLSV